MSTRGSLEQFDGTPIDTVPTDVSDPARQVVFSVPPHGHGNPFDTFHYAVTNPFDNRRSAWGRLDVNVSPVPDRPVVDLPLGLPVVLEGRDVLIRATAFDADDSVDLLVSGFPSPSFASVFQVLDDNRTPGALITEAITGVTNDQGWVLFRSAPDISGIPQFTTLARDRDPGLFSTVINVVTTVTGVNDAPTARPRNHRGTNNLPVISVILGIGDVENYMISGVITRLPTRGDLYRNGVVSDANRVTAADPTFDGVLLAYQPHDPSAAGDPLDTFGYIATDGGLAAADTISIVDVGRPPTLDAVDEWVVLPGGTVPFSIGVSDFGNAQSVFMRLLTLPQHGTLFLEPPYFTPRFPVTVPPFDLPIDLDPIVPDGVPFTFSYEPVAGFTSIDSVTGALTPDSFSYEIFTATHLNLPPLNTKLFVCEDAADADGDGPADCCPGNPTKTTPGVCGCDVDDVDTDGDGTFDCLDECPTDPNKVAPGSLGCGVSEEDLDGDGVIGAADACPNDANKIAPGICGCGALDVDFDNDGVPFCLDACPTNPDRRTPGPFGCVPGAGRDADDAPDSVDACPDDANKSADSGNCGCGVADTDGDGGFSATRQTRRNAAAVDVVIRITPPLHSRAYAIEEHVSPGSIVTEVSSGGLYHARLGSIRWGPFLDNTPRELTYRRHGAGRSESTGAVDGIVSFDGYDMPIRSETSIGRLRGDADGDGDIDLADFLQLVQCFSATMPIASGCEALDLDADNDIDLADLLTFQASLAGAR